MIKNFNCPICNNNSWGKIGEITYKIEEHQKDGKYFDDNYTKLKRRILFNKWFLGIKEIKFHSQYCFICGFACYSPRPENEDIEIKYNFLQKHEPYVGALTSKSKKSIYLDHKRSNNIFKRITRNGFSQDKIILDIGGGDGRHLLPFYKNNYKCYLIDYNKYPVEGIIRLGSTIEDIPYDLKFDCIMFNLVLSHIAEPIPFLKKILNKLNDSGICYVEVPLNFCVDILWDPVANINYFTKTSLINTLRSSGFDIMHIKKTIVGFGKSKKLIIWALIKKSHSESNPIISGKKEIEELISPSYIMIIKRRFYEIRTKNSIKPLFRLIKQIFRKIINTLK